MDNQELTQQIAIQIGEAQKQPVFRKDIYHNDSAKGKHQFLFFIKPEITLEHKEIRLDSILHMMMEQLNTFQFTIEYAALLGATYLEKFDIIAQHYGMINAMSRDPKRYLTEESQAKFESVFQKSCHECRIIGSLEFLNEFKTYDAESLNKLWQNATYTIIGGGAYCAPIQLAGETLYMLNGFHPLQLQHFIKPGRSIVVFAIRGNIDWSVARNQFIGKTNPSDAASGSLRNRLLKNQEALGLELVSAGMNGFHLSAGPLEGLVELMRYESDFSTGNIKSAGDFVFGRLLKEKFSEAGITKMCQNEMMHFQGKNTGTFDLTEEKNNDEAISLLASGSFKS